MTSHVAIDAVWSQAKLKLDEPAYFKQLKAMKLGDGEEVEIRIERAVEAKRLAQVRLWFALVREISDHTGYDVKEMHELAKAAVAPADFPASLARYSKDQLSYAVDALIRWSAETVGLVLNIAA